MRPAESCRPSDLREAATAGGLPPTGSTRRGAQFPDGRALDASAMRMFSAIRRCKQLKLAAAVQVVRIQAAITGPKSRRGASSPPVRFPSCHARPGRVRASQLGEWRPRQQDQWRRALAPAVWHCGLGCAPARLRGAHRMGGCGCRGVSRPRNRRRASICHWRDCGRLGYHHGTSGCPDMGDRGSLAWHVGHHIVRSGGALRSLAGFGTGFAEPCRLLAV